MYEPKLKLAIKSSIYHFIYDQPLTKLRKEFEEIIVVNDNLANASNYQFFYRGKRHKWQDNIPAYVPCKVLHEALHERMDLYLAASKVIEDEIPLTMGYVQNVLNKSDDPADFVKLLPSALHPPIQALVEMLGASKTLSLTDAEQMIKTHSKSIDLIKQRLMFNLLSEG